MKRRKPALGGHSGPDAELLVAALTGYQHQRSEIEAKMAELRRQLGSRAVRAAVDGSDGVRPAQKKRTMSAAARKRIAAAQRKRWAVYKKAKNQSAVPAAKPAKRKMSAEGRKRIAEASKKRWAKVRAQKAT